MEFQLAFQAKQANLNESKDYQYFLSTKTSILPINQMQNKHTHTHTHTHRGGKAGDKNKIKLENHDTPPLLYQLTNTTTEIITS